MPLSDFSNKPSPSYITFTIKSYFCDQDNISFLFFREVIVVSVFGNKLLPLNLTLLNYLMIIANRYSIEQQYQQSKIVDWSKTILQILKRRDKFPSNLFHHSLLR